MSQAVAFLAQWWWLWLAIALCFFMVYLAESGILSEALKVFNASNREVERWMKDPEYMKREARRRAGNHLRSRMATALEDFSFFIGAPVSFSLFIVAVLYKTFGP